VCLSKASVKREDEQVVEKGQRKGGNGQGVAGQNHNKKLQQKGAAKSIMIVLRYNTERGSYPESAFPLKTNWKARGNEVTEESKGIP